MTIRRPDTASAPALVPVTGCRLRIAPALLVAAALCALTQFLLSPATVRAAAPPPDIAGSSAIVIESSSGDVTYAEDADVRRPIASATKLMTALVVLESARLNRIIRASDYQPAAVESQLGLRPREKMTVADLLRALLLASANDAAVTLAEGVGGSRARFVAAMNRRARELGLKQTHFANPIGLDQPGNYSSARDLVQLSLQLRTSPFFRRTVARATATLKSGDVVRTVSNRNSLVARPQIDGIKTGHTGRAGYVLIASARDARGVRLLSAVLGAPTELDRNDDTLDLLRWGFKRYKVVSPVRRGQRFTQSAVPIRYRRGAQLPVAAATTVRRVVKRGSGAFELAVEDLPDSVEGPVRRGQQLGIVSLSQAGRHIEDVPLVAAAAVPAPTLSDKAIDWLTRPAAVGGLLIAVIGSVLCAGLLLRRRLPRARTDAAAPTTP